MQHNPRLKIMTIFLSAPGVSNPSVWASQEPALHRCFLMMIMMMMMVMMIVIFTQLPAVCTNKSVTLTFLLEVYPNRSSGTLDETIFVQTFLEPNFFGYWMQIGCKNIFNSRCKYFWSSYGFDISGTVVYSNISGAGNR